MINPDNIIQLTGRLTRDPELRSTGNGTEVASFRIAVDRGYAKKGEEKQTDFIDIVAWRQTGVFVNNYFRRGSLIKVIGSLQMRNYEDKTGAKRTAYEVIAEAVAFVGSKSDNPAAGAAPAAASPANAATDGTADLNVVVDDDDYPF